MIGCSEPWCVPGRSVECACIGGGKGAQTCAPSGQEYLQCICPDVSPTPTPIPTAQTSVVSKLVSSARTDADQRSALPGVVNDRSSDNTGVTLELAPIKISRVSTSDPSSSSASAQGTRMWWLLNESTLSCELSDDINATTHPAQLLAQGCYTKLSAHGKMRIKCDGAPMGPKTYLFAESHARCREILRPPSRDLPSDFQRASSVTVNSAPASDRSSAHSRARSYLKDTWHCMCYQELFQGQPSDSTACRKTRESCLDLEQKVAEGSPVLIKGSMSVGCKRVKAKEPWDVFGVRYQWLHSSQPGAWWTPRGCFLNGGASSKRARVRSRSSSQSSSRSSNTSTATKRAQAKRASDLPAAVTRPIEEEGRCSEACWAHLARDSERLQRFKQRSAPARYDFAAPFARRVNLIVDTCEARKKQQKSRSYRKECLRGGVKACTKLCERAQ